MTFGFNSCVFQGSQPQPFDSTFDTNMPERVDYHIRTRHKTWSEVWKAVEHKGFFGALEEKNGDSFQLTINNVIFIKHSLQTTLIETPIREIIFESNLSMDICLNKYYTNKQLVILRDYLDHTLKATNSKILAEKLIEPDLNLVVLF